MAHVDYWKQNFTTDVTILRRHVSTSLSNENVRIIRALIDSLAVVADRGGDDNEDMEGIEGNDNDNGNDLDIREEDNGNEEMEIADDVGAVDAIADAQEIIDDDDRMGDGSDIDMPNEAIENEETHDKDDDNEMDEDIEVDNGNGTNDMEVEAVDNGGDNCHSVAYGQIAAPQLLAELPPDGYVMLYANQMDCTFSTVAKNENVVAHGQLTNVVLGTAFGGADGQYHPFVVTTFPVHDNMNRAVHYQDRLGEVINRVSGFLEANGRRVYGFCTDDGTENHRIIEKVAADFMKCPVHDFMDMGPHYSPSTRGRRIIIFTRVIQAPLEINISELKAAYDNGEFNFTRALLQADRDRFWDFSTSGFGRDNIAKLIHVGSARCRLILRSFAIDPPAHVDNRLNEGLELYVELMMHICAVVENMFENMNPGRLRLYFDARNFFNTVQFGDANGNVHLERIIQFINRVEELYNEIGGVFMPGIMSIGIHYTALQAIYNENGQQNPNMQFLENRLMRDLDCAGGSEFGNLRFVLRPQPPTLRPYTELPLPIAHLPPLLNLGAILYPDLLPVQPTQQEIDDLEQAVAIREHMRTVNATDLTRYVLTNSVKDFLARLNLRD